MNATDQDRELNNRLSQLEAPELSEDFYLRLRAEAGNSRRQRPLPRFRTALVVAVAVAAALAFLSVADLDGRSPQLNIVDDAYAAVSQTSGVAHYVVKYGDPATTGHYEEHWADLNRPGHRRIVITSQGNILRQLVYIGPTDENTFSAEGEDARTSKTVILREPPVPGLSAGSDPSRLNIDPARGYEEMLRTGEVESEREVTVDGRAAYELRIRLTLRGRPATIKYVVDRTTFYPIEHEVDGGGGIQFVQYEVLSDTPQNLALLEPASDPTPYQPTR